MSEFLDYGDPAAMRRYIPKLEAELARLREENESLLDANVSVRRDLQASWEEKDRLREENERLRERGDWAVEQLRLAEAAGEQLRDQLSLNRIHDRDCVARENRLHRIEEAARQALSEKDTYVLIAALADPPTDASIGWGHSDGQTS